MESDEYERICAEWESRSVDRWLDLRDALSTRPGWHFEVSDDGSSPVWCFGEYGACVLAVTPRPDLVMLYIHAADREKPFGDIDGLLWWLGEHEHEYAELTLLQEHLVDSLARPENLEKMLAADDPVKHEGD